jgi:hypothetical protein
MQWQATSSGMQGQYNYNIMNQENASLYNINHNPTISRNCLIHSLLHNAEKYNPNIKV